MPATMATVVMTMGQRALVTCFQDGFEPRLAGAHFLDGEIHQQNGILRDDAHEHQDSDDPRAATGAGR